MIWRVRATQFRSHNNLARQYRQKQLLCRLSSTPTYGKACTRSPIRICTGKSPPSVVLVVCAGKGYGTGFFLGPKRGRRDKSPCHARRDAGRDHHPPRPEVPGERCCGRGPRQRPRHALDRHAFPDEIRGLTVNPSTDAGDRIFVVSRHKVIASVPPKAQSRHHLSLPGWGSGLRSR